MRLKFGGAIGSGLRIGSHSALATALALLVTSSVAGLMTSRDFGTTGAHWPSM
jgi:hypothetical protein